MKFIVGSAPSCNRRSGSL